MKEGELKLKIKLYKNKSNGQYVTYWPIKIEKFIPEGKKEIDVSLWKKIIKSKGGKKT
ncbi:MAG: hypothetical protein ACHQ1D_00940 [Nitrososphaerales archaeon]